IYADGGTAAGFTTERYTYDAINRLTTLRRDGLLLDARYYDGADRVVLSGIDGSLGKAFFDRSGLAGEQRRNVYDGAGRLYSARVLKMTDAGLSGGYATTYSGYDQAGNVTQYRMDVYDGSPYTNTYTYAHDRFEGYREKTLSGTSTALDPGQTTYQYDVNGNLIGVVDTKDASKNQTLVNDASGKILQRVQNGQTIRSLVVNGELLGTTGPAAGADDFSPSFRPIDGGNPSASPGSYRIQAGDTLQSIAQQAYGDSRLWYLVAEANGLASDRDLRVGATVTIPNRVSGNHNDYKSFKPYDPGKLIGDTQPTMPVPKPDSGGGGGCGGIGMIIVAVVAVVATVFTAGALAPVAAGAATGFGATMAAGAAVLTGASAVSGLAAVGIGLAAGAVGSIVSQGVGMAIGVQSKFSWKGVATSALGAGVTAGVGAAFNGANFLSGNQALVDAAARGAATGFTTGSTAVDMALRATVSSTMSQGIAMATGLQSKFNWTNVAAAGIGAGVGSAVGAQVFPNASDFSERLARGFVAGAAGGVAASVLSGGKANYLQIATDAFGNALGNSVVERLAAQTFGSGSDSVQLRGIRVDEKDLPAWAREAGSQDLPKVAGPRQSNDAMYDALVAEFGRARDERSGSSDSGTLVAGPAMLVKQGPKSGDEDIVTMPGTTAYSDDTWEFEGTPRGLLFSPGTPVGLEGAPWEQRKYSGAGISSSFLDDFGRGFNGGHLGVMEGPSPSFGVTAGDAAREFWGGTKALWSSLSGAGSVDSMSSNWQKGNYGQAVLYGLKSLGEAGSTVFGIGLTKAPVVGLSGSNISATSTRVLSAGNTTGTGAKLSFDTSLNVVDRAFSKEAGLILSENGVGRASYARLQAQGTEVRFVNDPQMHEMGLFNPYNNTVTVNMLRHTSAKEAASTVVHEAVHQNRAFRSKILPTTQYEEYLAFRNEFLFSESRRPSLIERQLILDRVQELYPHLPSGKIPFGG
ncbi:LysM peptidoglycan-binding domain-containing protein, partial [Achromobacter sp. DH1f]|uniref:LysM peptidoglycan-binding domain-containing protein n=1 Tax=Achromobacter sp. DH1f TaxID=1397275 RepID=UPI000E2001B8